MIRKILAFFVSIFLLLATAGALYMASLVYNAGDSLYINPFFFQPNDAFSRRVGVPANISDLGDDRIIEILIKKYVSEYFYVMPDYESTLARQDANGALFRCSSEEVFNDWMLNEYPTIQKMASANMMRTAVVVDEIQKPIGSDYWIVNYTLNTWEDSNNITESPTVSKGILLMQLRYEPGIRESIVEMGIHNYLDRGGNIVGVFKFVVEKLEKQ